MAGPVAAGHRSASRRSAPRTAVTRVRLAHQRGRPERSLDHPRPTGQPQAGRPALHRRRPQRDHRLRDAGGDERDRLDGRRTATRPREQPRSVTGKLWIELRQQRLQHRGRDAQASTVFFDAKSISAANLAAQRHPRLRPRRHRHQRQRRDHPELDVLDGPGRATPRCPEHATTPSLTRARLVIGAGSFSANPSSTVSCAATTVLLRGGVHRRLHPGDLRHRAERHRHLQRPHQHERARPTGPRRTRSPARRPRPTGTTSRTSPCGARRAGSHDIGGGGVDAPVRDLLPAQR